MPLRGLKMMLSLLLQNLLHPLLLLKSTNQWTLVHLAPCPTFWEKKIIIIIADLSGCNKSSKNGSGISLLLVKGHNCKTQSTFYCCIFFNHVNIVIQTLSNLFWHLYPFPLSLTLQKGRKKSHSLQKNKTTEQCHPLLYFIALSSNDSRSLMQWITTT